MREYLSAYEADQIAQKYVEQSSVPNFEKCGMFMHGVIFVLTFDEDDNGICIFNYDSAQFYNVCGVCGSGNWYFPIKWACIWPNCVWSCVANYTALIIVYN